MNTGEKAYLLLNPTAAVVTINDTLFRQQEQNKTVIEALYPWTPNVFDLSIDRGGALPALRASNPTYAQLNDDQLSSTHFGAPVVNVLHITVNDCRNLGLIVLDTPLPANPAHGDISFWYPCQNLSRRGQKNMKIQLATALAAVVF